MRRGDVWWATLTEPWGRRPVLLVARDEAYSILTWVMVAPLTTTLRAIPTAVLLDPATDGVPQRCVVSLDTIRAIRTDWLYSLIVPLRSATMGAVDRAIHFSLRLRR